MYSVSIKWYNYTTIPNILILSVYGTQLYSYTVYNYTTIQLYCYTLYTGYFINILRLYSILYSIAGIIASKYLWCITV